MTIRFTNVVEIYARMAGAQLIGLIDN